MNGVTYCILMVTVCVLAAFKSMKRFHPWVFTHRSYSGYQCFSQWKKLNLLHYQNSGFLFGRGRSGKIYLFVIYYYLLFPTDWSVRSRSRTITKSWRHPPGLKTSQIWIWLSSGAVPEKMIIHGVPLAWRGSLFLRRFGFLLWVNMNPTTRGSPLEACAAATISGLKVVAHQVWFLNKAYQLCTHVKVS